MAASKAEIRRWLKRVREDVRDLERALQLDDAIGVVENSDQLGFDCMRIRDSVADRYPDAAASADRPF